MRTGPCFQLTRENHPALQKKPHPNPLTHRQNPWNSSPEHPPVHSPHLPNPKVDIVNFLDCLAIKARLGILTFSTQLKAYPRRQPHLFPKPPTVGFSKSWAPPTVRVTLRTTGTQGEKLIGYETPCDTPGEFTVNFREPLYLGKTKNGQ
jgi:hypothetical protein